MATKRKTVPKKPTISRIIWANIRRKQYILGLPDSDLAMILECSEKTLRNYDRNPENVTLATVQLFCKNTCTEAAELVA